MSTSNPTYRNKFGEPSYASKISFTVDGDLTFRTMYKKMDAAEQSICISNYDLYSELPLIRESSVDLSNGKGRVMSQTKSSQTLLDLLLRKASRGVRIKILIWQPRLIIRILPGAKKRGMDGRMDGIKILSKKIKDLGLQNQLTIRLDKTSPSKTGGHHEKIMIIDNKIGFCGGFDLSQGKWDTSNHEYSNDLRDKNSEPWHDLHGIIEGPVISDLTYHFEQRWNYSLSGNVNSIHDVKFPYIQNTKTNGSHQIIALRTWKKVNHISDILRWYSSMFRSAKNGIYIENQFAFQYGPIAQLLVRRLKQQDQLKVIIVLPFQPNLPGFARSIITKISINDILRNLNVLQKTFPDRVKIYSLLSQDHHRGHRLKQVYVHSKLLIVDDKWITIGSANMDKNGFRDSTEFNLGISSCGLAKELRVKLWSEHLGMHSEDTNLNELTDFSKGFYLWEKIASENGRRVANGTFIQGHVYYFNFKHMNFPRPFKEATDAHKFHLI